MALNRKRRILISAVAVVGILLLVWSLAFSPASRARRIRIFMTRAEVESILGSPASNDLNVLCYGWTLTRLTECVFPASGTVLLSDRYPVLVRFDPYDHVVGVVCHGQVIAEWR